MAINTDVPSSAILAYWDGEQRRLRSLVPVDELIGAPVWIETEHAGWYINQNAIEDIEKLRPRSAEHD